MFWKTDHLFTLPDKVRIQGLAFMCNKIYLNIQVSFVLWPIIGFWIKSRREYLHVSFEHFKKCSYSLLIDEYLYNEIAQNDNNKAR